MSRNFRRKSRRTLPRCPGSETCFNELEYTKPSQLNIEFSNKKTHVVSKIMDLQTFAVLNFNSALDLILDTLQPETVTDDEEIDEYLMYDEEVEMLLVSFIDDIFTLITTVVEDASLKITKVMEDASIKMLATRQNLIRSVHLQVGSKLILACSLLLSFLSVWISVLHMSGINTSQLRQGLALTLKLIRTLETANQKYVRRNSSRGFFRRSRSLKK